MSYRISAVFKRSIIIERLNEACFETEDECVVFLNGTEALRSSRNVIELDGLEPDTSYTLSIDGMEQEFRTRTERILLDVKRFGAVGDGVHNDTNAIQAAIMACPADGTVYLGAGTYYTGPIFLKSDMTLWVDEGATILADTDRAHYPVLPGVVRNIYDNDEELNFASWEGNPLDSFASVITAISVENTDIVGRGTIDGNGDKGDWWIDVRKKRIAWRPKLVSINYSQSVRMAGLHLRNSACWTVHPYYSCDVSLYNVDIWNPSNSPNTDGIDPESCEGILMLGVKISVGDDCVAIKSGKLYMAQAHFRRTQDVEIRNCRFERGHGSITVGSEVACGVDGVHVSHCVFSQTDRGLRIKTRRGRGQKSLLTGLLFENIKMDRVHMPVTVNMFYFCDPDGHSAYVQNQDPAPVDYRTPKVGSIEIRNVDCSGVDACFLCANGLPESPIESIRVTNVNVSYLPPEKRTPQCPIMMDGFPKLAGRSIVLKNVDSFEAVGLTITGAADDAPELVNVKNPDARVEYIKWV
ncbi:MAG: glycoside hydrolase family 28 protein [Lachnospiraceae bacterium]|nr:glycoside hydrolase family 28 protein [Lachnospiraceae bacterium]